MSDRIEKLFKALPENGVIELHKIDGGLTRRVCDLPVLLIGLGRLGEGSKPIEIVEEEKGKGVEKSLKAQWSKLSTNAASRKAAKVALDDGTKMADLPSPVKAAIAEGLIRKALEITPAEWTALAAYARQALQAHEKLMSEQAARSSYQRPSGSRMVFTAIK